MTRGECAVIHPLNDHVLIRPHAHVTQTESGLHLAVGEPLIEKGEVLAVGPGRWHKGERIPLDVAVGDAVLYDRYSGTEVRGEEGEELVMLRQDEILTRLESLDVQVMSSSFR
jgi:chaperonin GroES